MDIRNPMGAIFPGAHGAVLSVLSRTYEPLSGRRVAALTDGLVGKSQAIHVLAELAASGVVLSEDRPPARLYRLNRDHVAARAIGELASLWPTLLEDVRAELASWQVPPLTACLFGSAARGDAGPGSDIDILLVRADPSDEKASLLWEQQVERLTERVLAWSGNACEVLELTVAELLDAAARDDRLVQDLRTDAVPLAGEPLKSLLGRESR